MQRQDLASVQVPLHLFIRLFCVQLHAPTITDRRGCACNWHAPHGGSRMGWNLALCADHTLLASHGMSIHPCRYGEIGHRHKTPPPWTVKWHGRGVVRDAQPLGLAREASLSRRLALAVTKALYLSISLNWSTESWQSRMSSTSAFITCSSLCSRSRFSIVVGVLVVLPI